MVNRLLRLDVLVSLGMLACMAEEYFARDIFAIVHPGNTFDDASSLMRGYSWASGAVLGFIGSLIISNCKGSRAKQFCTMLGNWIAITIIAAPIVTPTFLAFVGAVGVLEIICHAIGDLASFSIYADIAVVGVVALVVRRLCRPKDQVLPDPAPEPDEA